MPAAAVNRKAIMLQNAPTVWHKTAILTYNRVFTLSFIVRWNSFNNNASFPALKQKI
ncbi:hypothetical protein GQ600_24421 [Phytophthora cactorum]|nr:hypothetical protein GQ600_24421 [Phytophthora cactorum]